jgi:hypothetical protein
MPNLSAMSTAASPSMFCTRCNKPRSDADRCPGCGAKLKTLASQQRRGWIALGGAALLAVLMGAVWIWVDRLLGADAQHDAATARFLGKMNVAFALIVVSGGLGVANGWTMAHSGRRNFLLILGFIVAFGVGLFVAARASGSYQAR